MKRIFSNSDQVIHLWANQTQDSARSSNVFFEGKSIYSYGHHYELGRLTYYKGKPIALINNSGYSNTTAKHISRAWQAVEGMTRLFCDHDFDVEKAIIQEQDILIKDFFNHFSRTKFYQSWNYESPIIDNRTSEFNQLCDLLGFEKHKLLIDKEWATLYSDHIKIRLKREEEVNSPEMLLKKQQKLLNKAQEDLTKWRQSGMLTNAVRSLDPQLLRIVGEEVETSRGAKVPLTHAKRLLRLVERRKAKSGEKVGHFTLNSICSGIVKIGCHNIAIIEAKKILGE